MGFLSISYAFALIAGSRARTGIFVLLKHIVRVSDFVRFTFKRRRGRQYNNSILLLWAAAAAAADAASV